MWDREPRWQRLCRAQTVRMQNIWDKRGMPEWSAHTELDDKKHTIKPGQTVRGWSKCSVSMEDSTRAWENLPILGMIERVLT